MATNFKIVSENESGMVIRLIDIPEKMIDCRYPITMQEDQRMGWVKSTANECLRNMGKPECVVDVPLVIVTNPDGSVIEFFDPSTNTENLPEHE